MSHHVHKLKAFVVKLEDRPGSAAKLTADLKNHDLNLKGLWGWTEQPGVAYAAFVPEDPDKVSSCGCDTCCAAEPMSVLWLEGDDRTGALDDSLQAIAAAGIGIRNGVALAAGGRYAGALVFADDADLDKALAVLGECCA